MKKRENKDYCVENLFSEKTSFKITSKLLEKLMRQSHEAGKEPMLILGIPKNEHDFYKLTCTLSLESI